MQEVGAHSKVCRSGGNHCQFQHQSGADKRRPTHTVQETSPIVEEQFTIFLVEEPHSHQPMMIQVEVQGKQLSMELDTGATVSIISSITKQQMFPAEQLLSTSTIPTTYTGAQMAVVGRMEVEVRCDGRGVDYSFMWWRGMALACRGEIG